MATEKLSDQGFVSNYIGSDNILYTNNFKIKDIDETVKKLNNALFDNIVDDVNVNMSEAISSENSNISNIYTLNTSEPGKYNFKGNNIASIIETSNSSDNYYKNFLTYIFKDNYLRFSPDVVNEKIRVMNKNNNEYEICKISNISDGFKINNVNKDFLFSSYIINNKIFRNNLNIYHVESSDYLTPYARKRIYIKYNNFEYDSTHSDDTYYYVSCKINLNNYSEIPSIDNIIGIDCVARNCDIDCDLCFVTENIITIYVKITKPYQYTFSSSNSDIISIIYQNIYYGAHNSYLSLDNYQDYDFNSNDFSFSYNEINENVDKYAISKSNKIYLIPTSRNSSEWKPGDTGYLNVSNNDIISKYKIYSLTFNSIEAKENITFIITYIYGNNDNIIRTLINWLPAKLIPQKMVNLEIQTPGGFNYNGAYIKLNCFLDPYNVEDASNFFNNAALDNVSNIETIRNFISSKSGGGDIAKGLVAVANGDEFISYLNNIRSNQINIKFSDSDHCAYIYSAFAEEETPINMKTIIPYNYSQETIVPGQLKTLLSFGPDKNIDNENYKCCAHISFNYIVPSVEFIGDSTKFNNFISSHTGYIINHKLELYDPSNLNKNYWEKIANNKYKYNATYLVYHSEENGSELELSYLLNNIFLYKTYVTANENIVINQDNPFTIQKDTLRVYISSTDNKIYLNISAEIVPNWDSSDPFSSQNIGYRFSINNLSAPGTLRPMLYSISNNTMLLSTSIDSNNRNVSNYFPSGVDYYNNVSVKCNSYITNIISEFKTNPTNVETDLFVSRLGFKDSHITQKNINKINVLDDSYSEYFQNATSDTNSQVIYHLPKMTNLYTLKNKKFGLGTLSESETPENGFVRIIF